MRVKVKAQNAFDEKHLTPNEDYFCISTVCIRDLDNLNLIWWLDFRLKPIFAIASAALKNTTHFKRGQKCLQNKYIAFLPK